VRGAAVWALGRLLTKVQLAALGERRRAAEMDADVADEWAEALA
jgi:hypothetical protein